MPQRMCPQTILWITHSRVYLPIRCDPILISLNPDDRDKHPLEGFYGADLLCQCPKQYCQEGQSLKFHGTGGMG